MSRKVCIIDGCPKVVEGHGWCSKHYSRWQRHGSPTARLRGEVVDGCKICPGCGVDTPLPEFGTNLRGSCHRCIAERARARRAANPIRRPKSEAVCEHCGAAFMADKRRWRYCSPECSRARMWADNWKNTSRRRIKERSATTEIFTREEIFERDGWTCGLCSEHIDPSARKPDLRCASIDHIVPISKGGEHSRANVQAAHLICNLTKGDRVLADGVA